MSRPLPAGLREARSRLPRDAVMVRAAVVAVATVPRRAGVVTGLPQPDVEPAVLVADAVEQLRPQPVRICLRTAGSRPR